MNLNRTLCTGDSAKDPALRVDGLMLSQDVFPTFDHIVQQFLISDTAISDVEISDPGDYLLTHMLIGVSCKPSDATISTGAEHNQTLEEFNALIRLVCAFSE